ncbi:hypothetical protein [Pseudonocardia asaccharolytica]|uniref:Glycosyltransferase RgtA/B/C/D-like domain-containing protein n=1 Tax=Pseudonocardia asaccharolytica DSM 44247 = NBRC 16224 TaxID=1123024 RepID=A0A511CWU3_9PSEU|nr:hypothetical protein [Pseudonocardia asaccharolytica]GEL16723.1 hypothetical protein PA7_05600 [Pseudonocardia asaccharolytica DSM 44247 = NBRC 16224]
MTSTGTRSPGDGQRHGDLDPPTTLIPVTPPAEAPTTALPVQPPNQPVPPPSRPQAQDTAPVAGWWRWLSPVLAALALLLLPVAAATTDLDALDGWGLAKILPPAAWASLALAVAACVAELWSPRPRIPMLGVATAVLILCSVGMPSVVQPTARFTTAWLLAGFTDAIAGTGVPPTGIDARFFWPAFFAQWAFFRDAGGATQLDEVLRWFPPVVVGVWAIGVYALARSMLGGTRTPWVAAWLFVGLNWIEQDYYSPQATGIVLLLTVLTFCLGPLATRRTDAAGVPSWPAAHPDAPKLPLLRRWAVAAMTPPNRPTLPPRQLLLIYFCAALCLLAVAPAHQLTPFAIIGQLAVLAVVGRFRGRGLVIVAVLAVMVYFLIAARDFWMTQLSLITGSGDEEGALQAGIADRLTGDTGQVVVKLLRIAVPGLTWLLAIAGAWVYWRRRRDLVPIALAAVPMAFAAQGYGGEVFLRIVLYGLPILTILGTDALRSLVRRNRAWEKVLAVGMLVTFGTLVLIRGGNDAYMLVTPEDVTMTRQVYAEAPPGSKVMPLSNVGPYGLEGIGEYHRGSNVDGCVHLANDPLRCIDEELPDYLLIYPSIENEGVYLNDKPPGWSQQLVQELVATGNYVVQYQHGFNAVLVKRGMPGWNTPLGGDLP